MLLAYETPSVEGLDILALLSFIVKKFDMQIMN